MSVAVVGGGYAGMAAAVTLADAGVPVTVYEAAAQLGGRARRVMVNDVALDNGLHILIGAYRETLRLVSAMHNGRDMASPLMRLPLDWQVYGRFRLRAARLPAPFHLAVGLLTVRGAPWRERLLAVQFMRSMRARKFRLAHDLPVAELLAAHRQGPAFVRYLWRPLCVAALNTPVERASAQVFLNVLREGLDAGRSAGDLLLARMDLSSLFPTPAAEHVRGRGGEVLISQKVEAIAADEEGVVLTSKGREQRYSHVICAVSPHGAAALLGRLPALAPTIALLKRLRYQPIYSVYLQFTQPVRLSQPMLALAGLAQWVFDREAISNQRGLLAAVISAEGEHQTMTQLELAQRVHRELESALGPLPPLAWQRVIAEKRATFECSVDLQRPATSTPLRNVHLAGDYTASDYPATLEAAVRSGIAAANQVTC